MTETLVLAGIVLYTFYVAWAGFTRPVVISISPRVFYRRSVLIQSLALIVLLLLLGPAFAPIDMDRIGRGFTLPEGSIWGIFAAFGTPLFLALLFRRLFEQSHRPYDDRPGDSRLLGFPVALLPRSYRQFFLFVLFIAVGVVFEEILFRQVLFYLLFHVTGLGGDLLVVVSAVLFALGHSYQGIRGVVTSFIGGLLLGKVFLETGNLMIPVVMHGMLNATIWVLAYRRLNDHSAGVQADTGMPENNPEEKNNKTDLLS